MCRAFGVSRSGYYDWAQHKLSNRKQSDERLKLEIKVAHTRTRQTYGALRLLPELASKGIAIGRDKLVRLRKEMGLRCKQKRKFIATTNSDHSLPVAPACSVPPNVPHLYQCLDGSVGERPNLRGGTDVPPNWLSVFADKYRTIIANWNQICWSGSSTTEPSGW